MTEIPRIVFGNNRVAITPVALDFEAANGIAFQRLPENDDKIGTYYSTGEFTSPNLEGLVNFEFLNTKSIDVLILKLQELREVLGKPWVAGELIEHPDAIPLPVIDKAS